METKIFSAALLIDGTGSSPIKDPYIVVRDGVIQEIASGEPSEALTQGAERLDMPEATIIPGLIDAHVHLGMGMSLPNWAQISADPVRLALVVARNAGVSLRAGVTTVADCGVRYGVTIQVRDAIAQGAIPGSRIWSCGAWLTVTNGHGYFWTQWGLDSADELRKGVREMVWQGADFIKIMASGGSTQGSTTNRRRAQYSVAELRAAVEDAHRLNKRVHCHVNAAEAMRHCIEAGVDVVEHCNWLGVAEGTIDYDEEAAKVGGRNGLYAGINVNKVFEPLSAHDGAAQDWGALTRWDLMRRMQEAGVRIFIDTDAEGAGFGMLPHYMARMVAEDKAGAMEVIEMATRIPAEAMGVADTLGSLEKGKRADMVFLPQNPLLDMDAVTRPLLVVKEGGVVVQNNVLIS